MEQKQIELRKKLKDATYNFSKIAESEDATIADMSNGLNALCDTDISIIKDFFSDNEGEGERIRKVYQKAADILAKTPRLTIPNINMSNHLYSEYFDGMKQYISNELTAVGEIDSAVQVDKIKEFIGKDSDYISSLFGDGTNVQFIENASLEDSLVNLEVLIEFIPALKERASYVNTLQDEIQTRGILDQPGAKALVKMYVFSVARYSDNLIDAVFNSFQTITDALNYKPVIIPKAEIKPEPKFQLF